MSVTTDIRKDGDTVTATGRFNVPSFSIPTIGVRKLTKPLYAYVGAADLWLAQVKAVPTELEKVGERIAVVPAAVKTLPVQIKALRDEVETRVAKATDTVSEKASDAYTVMSLRGERLVTQIRRQPATEAAIAEGKEVVRKAEAAAIAARKSVQAGEKAVSDAAGKLG